LPISLPAKNPQLLLPDLPKDRCGEVMPMPIYEYQCRGCCHCFEHLALKAEEPAPACPDCGCGDVEKLMSAGCVLTKSSGGGESDFTQARCAPSG
jgi:putative FmdB family regulatory protein